MTHIEPSPPENPEQSRVGENERGRADWKLWGPYLSARQWGTAREDYSASGDAWKYFTHDQARSRVYRWGEDGLLGICDRDCLLCFSIGLWNGRDPILKERLFGLSNPEGNHGEDVKECYFYLDGTPTHSYLKALYKYPQAAFPYVQLIEENQRRGLEAPEFELTDTAIFDENRYFDVLVEYAKAWPQEILIRITISNRGPDCAPIDLLPTLWFRNTWSWGSPHVLAPEKPEITRIRKDCLQASHPLLGQWFLCFEPAYGNAELPVLFTENETNTKRLFGEPNPTPFVKDAFHEYVIHGRKDTVNPGLRGTKAAFHCQAELGPGETRTFRLSLSPKNNVGIVPEQFDQAVQRRSDEADRFYQEVIPPNLSTAERQVMRQAFAGLVWNQQFYHYIVSDWLAGDPKQPPPPDTRQNGRNHNWRHLYARDVISMPDKWEYPYFAAWDLAFQMVVFARLDLRFAQDQLLLLLGERYMSPQGQIPAYEFSFSNNDPPVQAWAAWAVYQMSKSRGRADRSFLESVFQKLLLNFNWWLNRTDLQGVDLFSGGFLGLDNISIVDRNKIESSSPMEQADATAWMAAYALDLLRIALELAQAETGAYRPYEDMAIRCLGHFIAIAEAINAPLGQGLWDEQDGFYYDKLRVDGEITPIKVRSVVGLIPLLAVGVLPEGLFQKLPGFARKFQEFAGYFPDLCSRMSFGSSQSGHGDLLLALPHPDRLRRVLAYVLDEREFLSPFGIRSVSKYHERHPFGIQFDGEWDSLEYWPGPSRTHAFAGNSNWRGPVWFPVNYLFVEVLRRYGNFYGEKFKIECPTGSGNQRSLNEVAKEISSRLSRLFLPGPEGRRPCFGQDHRYASDPYWRDCLLFNEYFHGETGQGLGACHQTGWTALVNQLLAAKASPAGEHEQTARTRQHKKQPRPNATAEPKK